MTLHTKDLHFDSPPVEVQTAVANRNGSGKKAHMVDENEDAVEAVEAVDLEDTEENSVVVTTIAAFSDFFYEMFVRLQQRYPIYVALIALVLGFAIGLFMFGWWLTPVEYIEIHPNHMSAEEQAAYVSAVSDLYAYQGDIARTQSMLVYWRGDRVACALALQTNDWAESMRLQTTAFVANDGQGCEIYWITDE